jgi:sulfoxide reductase heme-binding subunit YedZ
MGEPGRNDRWLRFALKPLVFLACLVPFGLLLEGAIAGDLRRLTGWTWLQRLRRMLGLFVFFYVSLHFLTWVWLDQGLAWGNIVIDIAKRPYVTVGFSAWLLLLPLALTSTRGMMRRLGRRWQRLHRTIYLIAVLGVLHYIWLVKADLLEPLIYASLLAILLAVRWRPQLLQRFESRSGLIDVR